MNWAWWILLAIGILFVIGMYWSYVGPTPTGTAVTLSP